MPTTLKPEGHRIGSVEPSCFWSAGVQDTSKDVHKDEEQQRQSWESIWDEGPQEGVCGWKCGGQNPDNSLRDTRVKQPILKGCTFKLPKPPIQHKLKACRMVVSMLALIIGSDFPEVFPKDLSGLPPTRQVEFQIDLVPGLAGYYRRFIEGFSKIAKPMTKLTQKKIKFEWGDKQEAAFMLKAKVVLVHQSLHTLKEGRFYRITASFKDGFWVLY
ncbi:hypothetical protein Tco_0973138 [Tanacetum coccineum]